MTRNNLPRREFIRMGGAACAAAACPSLAAAQRTAPVALQLYSLRNECKADLPGTLAANAKMGFSGVGWFGWGGYFNRSPKELRMMLDDNNLKTCSDHIHVFALQGDRFKRTIELHQTLGNKLLTLSDLTGFKGNRKTAQFCLEAAKQWNELAEKLKPYGMRLGLHNHSAEFVRLADGRVPWEIIFDNTSKDFAQQLYIAGALARGFDPADYLKRYPGRTLTMHMVDWRPGRKSCCWEKAKRTGNRFSSLRKGSAASSGTWWSRKRTHSLPWNLSRDHLATSAGCWRSARCEPQCGRPAAELVLKWFRLGSA
ncbi:MAG TPA: TIM barrel protein [Bryobacteraceae bacterium]|nr:TIM barrel protein [Bryobacteraceae bacterium]HPU70417.1 TIM barrel protein [Bryobacteraceae bacterium]